MYIVAVRLNGQNELFSFDNLNNANEFIEEIKHDVDSWAISEEIYE